MTGRARGHTFIQKQCGVKGLVNRFAKPSLDPNIRSWAGKGENHPISPAQIHRALGFATLQQLVVNSAFRQTNGGEERARKLFAMQERIIPATYSLYSNEKPLAMGR
jgi:hypothetical protein